MSYRGRVEEMAAEGRIGDGQDWACGIGGGVVFCLVGLVLYVRDPMASRFRGVLAAVAACLVVAGPIAVAGPAFAADGVDLRPVLTRVTFGAGSVVALPGFEVANSGTVPATGVHAVLDLVTASGTPELTFITAQRGGCTVMSSSRASCPMPDVPAGGSSLAAYGELIVSAVEARPRPGGIADSPMAVRLAVRVVANETELVEADNGVTSGVTRTVRSGATDYAVGVDVVRGEVGEVTSVEFSITNRGPSGVDTGETVLTYVAPPGTEWARDMSTPCVAVRPKVEYRCTSIGITPPSSLPGRYSFPLRILRAEVGQGLYRVEGMGGETKPADNVAPIVVQVGDATSSASPTPPAAGGGGGVGALPVTGAATAVAAVVGAAAVLAGAALFVLGRRRRIRLEPPTR